MMSVLMEKPQKEGTMLWIIFIILLALWLLGLVLDIAGGFIHLLLIVAAIMLLINLLSGRRSVV
jgi:hypothetical protein